MRRALFILLGEGGVGKSTLVNLLGGIPMARVSGGQDPCTRKVNKHKVPLSNELEVVLVDTPGLNSADRSLPDEKILNNVCNKLRDDEQPIALLYLHDEVAKRDPMLREKIFKLKSTNPHLIVIGEDTHSLLGNTRGVSVKSMDPELEEHQKVSALIRDLLKETPPERNEFLTSLRTLAGSEGARARRWYDFLRLW